MSPTRQDVTADRVGTPPRVPADTGAVLVAATLVALVLGVVAARANLLSTPALALAGLLWAGIAAAVVRGRHAHPHASFGAANLVTTLRALVAVAIAAFAVEAGSDGFAGAAGGLSPDTLLWAVTVAAVLSLALDGVDGPLARAGGLESAFGARYDMEIDALLALVLATLIWRTGELGAWVLALGTMRYLFIAAAWAVPALNAPLFPSLRRKTVCVVQIAALCTIVAPIVQPPLSFAIALAATLALGYSFARDTLWLLGRGGRPA